jgi:hypothetical protein
MHPATELLLKRLESHPEEFTQWPDEGEIYATSEQGYRWHDVMHTLNRSASDEEKTLIKQKLDNLAMDKAYERIVKRITGVEEEERKAAEEEKRKQYAQVASQMTSTYPSGPSDTVIGSNHAGTWGQLQNLATRLGLQQVYEQTLKAHQYVNQTPTISAPKKKGFWK